MSIKQLTKMNKEVKEKWLKALRSGEYSQCQERLTDGVGFCCLGVLTDMFIKETGRGEWFENVFVVKDNNAESDDNFLVYEETQLPVEVADWACIDSVEEAVDNPIVLVESAFDNRIEIEEHSLAELNDGSDDEGLSAHTFLQIADIIEKGIGEK